MLSTLLALYLCAGLINVVMIAGSFLLVKELVPHHPILEKAAKLMTDLNGLNWLACAFVSILTLLYTILCWPLFLSDLLTNHRD